MNQWFGKDCEYLAAQWEETEVTGGLNYKEAEPILKFCTNNQNAFDWEGNCNPKDCPIIIALKGQE